MNSLTAMFCDMAEGERELTNSEPEQDEMNSTLKEILKWTRFANLPRLKEVLERELDDDQKKLAYDNSDGMNGLKEISTISGAPYATVGSWWQKWFRLGIVTEGENRKGRMMKIISLDDIGIKVPKRIKSLAGAPSPQEQPTAGEQPPP